MPGCTHTVRASLSNSSTWFTWRDRSITSAAPTVWPHCEVPPPRGITGMPWSSAMRNAVSASRSFLGITTPTGSTW